MVDQKKRELAFQTSVDLADMSFDLFTFIKNLKNEKMTECLYQDEKISQQFDLIYAKWEAQYEILNLTIQEDVSGRTMH